MKTKEKDSPKQKILLLIVAVVGLLLFEQLASLAGSWFAKLFSYSQIDPDNTFMSITVHHIVQGIIALIAIFVI